MGPLVLDEQLLSIVERRASAGRFGGQRVLCFDPEVAAVGGYLDVAALVGAEDERTGQAIEDFWGGMAEAVGGADGYDVDQRGGASE
jgi:hypothetical protein